MTPVIISLIAIIAIGGIVIWTRYSGSQPIEISILPSQELPGEIYLGGAIDSPGFYPLKTGDSMETLIQTAGGAINSADLTQPKLYIPEVGDVEKPQKANINRAEVWLLKSLSGIG